MKLSLNFKNINWQELLVAHVEKIVIGVCSVLVLFILASTSWSSYKKSPQELVDQSSKSEADLRSSEFPDDEKAKYPRINLLAKVDEKVSPLPLDARLAYTGGGLSPKINPQYEPNDEPKVLAIQSLIADAGRFAMPIRGSGAPAPAAAGANAAQPTDSTTPAGAPQIAAPSSTAGRGMRYVCVRGAFPLQQQLQAIQRALHLDSTDRAYDYFEFFDVAIERQFAVAGPDPWAMKWEPVAYDIAFEIFKNEVEDFAPELVPIEFTDPSVTMPLPKRADKGGDWSEHALHPLVQRYVLDKKSQEAELAKNVVASLVANQVAKPVRVEGGFRGLQNNVRELRRAVDTGQVDPMKVAEAQAQVQQALIGEATPVPTPTTPNPREIQPRKNTVAAQHLLFRFFDFDVRPDACYRYRVKISLKNPSFELRPEQVRSPAVAEGKFRESEWSDISVPVVVPSESLYLPSKLVRAAGKVTGVDIVFYQWDSSVGSIIFGDKNLRVSLGQSIRGELKDYGVVDWVKQSNITKAKYAFQTKDVLVDLITSPSLPQQFTKPKGFDLSDVDRMITVTDTGEILTRDPFSTRTQRDVWEKQLSDQKARSRSHTSGDGSTKPRSGLDGVEIPGQPTGEGPKRPRPTLVNPGRVRGGG